MLDSYRLLLVPRWLAPMLGFLLVLGHACELPAVADLLSHAAEDVHHSADHHTDESVISCDAVGVPSSTGSLYLGVGLDLAEVAAVDRAVPTRLIVSSRNDSDRPPNRTPLFLLHASLRI
jgi:hypothetical protein